MGEPGLGYDRVNLIRGETFQDCRTVVVVPTRGTISTRVFTALQGLIAPMNQSKVGPLFAVAPVTVASGHEVGHAYNAMIEMILAHPELSKFPYILTLEDDNLPPSDALVRLLESIKGGGFDAVSGIYFTKGDINMPMAYGNPEEFARTGVLDFKPLDVRQMLARGNVVEVNGIAMGCALWRTSLFREISKPWFVTVADVIDGKGEAFTQDLWFCKNARLAGKRFAVDFRVKVGHLDINSGIVY